MDEEPRDLVIGLDLGGSKILVAAAAARGPILRQERQATPAEVEEGLDLIGAMIDRVREGRPLKAIAVAAGGPLDEQTGIISPLHQPGWEGTPLKSFLEARYDCPAAIEVDTNAAALGEYEAMTRPPVRLLYLTLSTGMGGGLLLDGRIYRGQHGVHPEVAHQAISFRCRYPERVTCECGLPDCLEALVSGNGIRRIYGRPAEELAPDEWEEVAWNLGQGLRNLATILAPEMIVLGGGVAIGGGLPLVRRAGEVMRRGLRLVPPPALQLSTLGLETSLCGALVIARRMGQV